MNRLTFHGASDDLVEIGGEGITDGPDEFNVLRHENKIGGGPAASMGVWHVWATDPNGDSLPGAVAVRAIYDGAWAFAVGPVFDPSGDRETLEWPDVRIVVTESEVCGYSAQVAIESDHGLRVRLA